MFPIIFFGLKSSPLSARSLSLILIMCPWTLWAQLDCLNSLEKELNPKVFNSLGYNLKFDSAPVRMEMTKNRDSAYQKSLTEPKVSKVEGGKKNERRTSFDFADETARSTVSVKHLGDFSEGSVSEVLIEIHKAPTNYIGPKKIRVDLKKTGSDCKIHRVSYQTSADQKFWQKDYEQSLYSKIEKLDHIIGDEKSSRNCILGVASAVPKIDQINHKDCINKFYKPLQEAMKRFDREEPSKSKDRWIQPDVNNPYERTALNWAFSSCRNQHPFLLPVGFGSKLAEITPAEETPVLNRSHSHKNTKGADLK